MRSEIAHHNGVTRLQGGNRVGKATKPGWHVFP